MHAHGRLDEARACDVRRRIHACHMRRRMHCMRMACEEEDTLHAHGRLDRAHACHMRRRMHCMRMSYEEEDALHAHGRLDRAHPTPPTLSSPDTAHPLIIQKEAERM